MQGACKQFKKCIPVLQISSYFISAPNKTNVSRVVFTEYGYYFCNCKCYKLMGYGAIAICHYMYLQTLSKLQIKLEFGFKLQYYIQMALHAKEVNLLNEQKNYINLKK